MLTQFTREYVTPARTALGVRTLHPPHAALRVRVSPAHTLSVMSPLHAAVPSKLNGTFEYFTSPFEQKVFVFHPRCALTRRTALTRFPTPLPLRLQECPHHVA